jgi:hypothetical protein
MLVLAYANSFWINFNHSAKGSDNRLPIETEPRTVIGLNSSRAILDAEYTEAPASETIKFESVYRTFFIKTLSRDAVPLPIEIASILYEFTIERIFFIAIASFLRSMWVNSFIIQ